LRKVAAVVLLLGLALAAGALAAPVLEDHVPRILVEAPSEVVAGEAFTVGVLVSDRWGPEGPEVPSAGVDRALALAVSSSDPRAELHTQLRAPRQTHGRATTEVTLRTPGLQTIWVDGEAGMAGESAPIRVLEKAPAARVYWGDLHAHLHTPGAGHAGELDPGEYAAFAAEALEFGRDVSRIDFCALTPHLQTAGGLARETERGSVWDAFVRTVQAANEPGRFVAFPGFEWQGDAGDHCVIEPRPGPLVAPADFRELARAVEERGALLTAHAIYLPTEFEPRVSALAAVEVTRDSHSTHELGLEALRKGLVPAFLGCSDTHGGALGATSLTGLRAPALTRAEILRAVRERRTWATNGERIVLDFAVDTTGDLPVVHVRGTGTAGIDRIEIFRGAESVARLKGSAASPEFDVTWEDGDLLDLEHLARTVTYHAVVTQVTQNRYDPSRRDVAISSPVEVELLARHFDAAHARRGGRPDARPGGALVRIRDVWDRFRAAPERALAVDPAPDADFEGWSVEDIEALREAARGIERRAAEDAALLDLAHDVAVLPGVAEAVAEAAEARREARALAGAGRLRGRELTRVRQRALDAHAAAARLRTTGPDADWRGLEEAWFAARLLGTLPAEALDTVVRLERRKAVPAVHGSGETVSGMEVPLDPRVLAGARPVTAHERFLEAERERRWGYTSRARPPGEDEPALRLRVVAEGRLDGATLSGGPEGARWTRPLEAGPRGWTAVLDRAALPEPDEPPLELSFEKPVRVASIFAEDADGVPLPSLGRVYGLQFDLTERIARTLVHCAGDSVEMALWAGSPRHHPLWDGLVGEGERTLVFPRETMGDEGRVTAQWGFAGWRRAGGVEIPGHEAARATGFGALGDGRAVLALSSELLVIDPVSGAVEHIAYPAGRRHEPDREFCVVPLAGGLALVRGADGPSGGWAAVLDPITNAWRTAPAGPETGTVAPHPEGGYAWLTGKTIRRRLVDGSDGPTASVDVTGRLLGFDPSGRAVVRGITGEAVRVSAANGAVVERIPGRALAMEPTGAVLLLAGLGARHAELAVEVSLERALADASRAGSHPIAVKAAPVREPPSVVAVAPDGALLVLGGTTWWRREPDHDWWGATVERWEPVWAGEIRSD